MAASSAQEKETGQSCNSLFLTRLGAVDVLSENAEPLVHMLGFVLSRPLMAMAYSLGRFSS